MVLLELRQTTRVCRYKYGSAQRPSFLCRSFAELTTVPDFRPGVNLAPAPVCWFTTGTVSAFFCAGYQPGLLRHSVCPSSEASRPTSSGKPGPDQAEPERIRLDVVATD